jgi:2-polyprenyl-3-methyl-5-hydroxy-6-metoxy-1,4-benzoquinol methylase
MDTALVMDERISADDRQRIQHAFNKIGWHIPEDVRTGGRFLDIGCGIGNGLIAAMKQGAALCVGIDRDLEEFGRMRFQHHCDALSVNTAQTLLIGGAIDTLTFGEPLFDFAMMLDVIEHVPDPARFIEFAYRNLRPGGYLLLDTCPLYYSVHGGHLFKWFTEDHHPWGHLYFEVQELVKEHNIDSWSVQRFLELNRVTHSEVVAHARLSGFEIMFEHRASATAERWKLYEKHRHRIDHSKIPNDSVLFEDWILLVCRK